MSTQAPNSDVPTFRLGIAMAGAVSAGAYTAGVIDYLLETLSIWEKAKARNRELSPDDPAYDHSIPMHDVVIEVIGGSSAGAMTAVVTAMALAKGLSPVHQPPDSQVPTGNLLYDAWVGLNDKAGTPTLSQMLQTDDLQPGRPLRSLLNSQPIREVGKAAAEQVTDTGEWPRFLSPNLDLLLTLSNLRGIPISLAFEPSNPQELQEIEQKLKEATTVEQINEVYAEHGGAYHTMKVHKTVAHFSLGQSSAARLAEPLPTIPIDLSSDRDRHTLLDYAIASGAFPLALSPVDFSTHSTGATDPASAYAPDRSYFLEQVKRSFKGYSSPLATHQRSATSPDQQVPLLSQVEQPYRFTAVDGGTLNNEPFGEVMRLLDRSGSGSGTDNHALLVIDPFPSSQEVEPYEFPQGILGLASQVIGALRGQAMVKEQEIRKGFSDDYTLAMLVPSRREHGQPAPCPIASGSLEGFGGFFHRSFREHDFFLGRKNCQSFLRSHFTATEKQLSRAGLLTGYMAQVQERTRSLTAEDLDRGGPAIEAEGPLYRRFHVKPPPPTSERPEPPKGGKGGSSQGPPPSAAEATPRGGLHDPPVPPAGDTRFPIIPDLRLSLDGQPDQAYADCTQVVPDFDAIGISSEELSHYLPQLRQRLAGVVDHLRRGPLPGLPFTFQQVSQISTVLWLVALGLLVLVPMPPLVVALVALLFAAFSLPVVLDRVLKPIGLGWATRKLFARIDRELKKRQLLR